MNTSIKPGMFVLATLLAVNSAPLYAQDADTRVNAQSSIDARAAVRRDITAGPDTRTRTSSAARARVNTDADIRARAREAGNPRVEAARIKAARIKAARIQAARIKAARIKAAREDAASSRDQVERNVRRGRDIANEARINRGQLARTEIRSGVNEEVRTGIASATRDELGSAVRDDVQQNLRTDIGRLGN